MLCIKFPALHNFARLFSAFKFLFSNYSYPFFCNWFENAALVTTFNLEIGITGAILTKLDGDSRGGAALSVKEVFIYTIPIDRVPFTLPFILPSFFCKCLIWFCTPSSALI